MCPGGNCFENLRIQGLAVSLADIVAQNAFGTAYLEMFVSSQLEPSYWSQVRMCVGDCAGTKRFVYRWITIVPDVGYARIEIPFTAMTDETDGAPLTAAALTEPVFEWAIGGTWAPGSTTRVDEVRIRY